MISGVIGAATGCASGVAAPVVATTALGAIANTTQYAVTRYVDGKPITPGGMALNFVLGGVGGRVGGVPLKRAAWNMRSMFCHDRQQGRASFIEALTSSDLLKLLCATLHGQLLLVQVRL
jgi:hypothetical protein